MLSRKMYTDEYIRELQQRTGNDPALLERVIYAFGMLEAIRRVSWFNDFHLLIYRGICHA